MVKMPAPHLTEVRIYAVFPKLKVCRKANSKQAKGPQDDWTGLKDAKQRKKLQNRLNVRAHRESQSWPLNFVSFSPNKY